MHIDVFNGDADGLCALRQLRLDQPKDSVKVTGVKRDIQLLERIQDQHHAKITVLDISMSENKSALLKLLQQENQIEYFDHHHAGDIPTSSALKAHINTSPTLCTSLIVDGTLQGRYADWAIAAAFGDNLHQTARQYAQKLGFAEQDITSLLELGELLNYNAYGNNVEDLHFAPDALYLSLSEYEKALDFFRDSSALPQLREGYRADLALAAKLSPMRENEAIRVYQLPVAKWCNRVAGVFNNLKSRENPQTAHALLVENEDGTFMVSVRAPLKRPQGADELCRKFPSGGGRASAAGINHLASDLLPRFLDEFEQAYTRT